MAQKKITDLSLRSNFDETVNLPGDDTAQTWRVTGQQIQDFITSKKSQSYEVENLGLAASVAANALTIAVKTQAGTDASSTNVIGVGTRSATITSGVYSRRTITGALSIVVPSGASLGHVSAMNQYVWVYLLNNSGTLEFAVSGVKLFDENSIQSTTAIGAGSTSGNTLYSTAARSSVPIRLIGRLLVNQTVAGVWASAVTEVALAFGRQPINVSDSTVYPMVITATTTNPTKGTTTVDIATWQRVGDQCIIQYEYIHNIAGTAGNGKYLFALPSGLLIDSAKMAINGTNGTGGCMGPFSSFDSSSANNIGFVYAADSSHIAGIITNGTISDFGSGRGAFSNANVSCSFLARVPIVGWSTYGP